MGHSNAISDSAADVATAARFNAIEGVRAIAAWIVVIWHVSSFSKFKIQELPYLFFLHGTMAVYLFIIVSGFVITHLLLTQRESYRCFITRRFFRLWPVHATMLIITTAYLISQGGSLMKLARHLAVELSMINGMIPLELMKSPSLINPPDWSISLEWQFYILAPFVIGLLARGGIAPTLFTAVLLVILLLGYPQRWTPVLPELKITFWTASFFPMQLKFFAVGIISYFVVASGILKDHFKGFGWMLAFIAVGIGLGQGHVESIAFAIWAAVLLALISPGSTLDRLLSTPWLRWLGMLSYATYISHWFVIRSLVTHVMPLSGVPIGSATYFVLLLAVTAPLVLALSILLNRYVEQPGIALGRRLT